MRKVGKSLFAAVAAIVAAMMLVSCGGGNDQKIKVAVFQGDGGAVTCIRETVAALSLDEDMEVRIVHSSDIAAGVLDSLDAIVIPGGGGSRQYLSLGQTNMALIKDFVHRGGGAVGICAGAYLFSNTPDYTCMALTGARAIDREHDNRGHGMAKMTLNKEGKKIFHELAKEDTSYVFYYEGPVFVESDVPYTSFGTMESDVHEEGGAPANMTNGKPFLTGNDYGKGKVFTVVGHPEATPGKMWMVPRMVRWTLGKPLKTYPAEVLTPPVAPEEILMSVDDLRYESQCFQTFLYGTAQEKVAALGWLEDHYSWDCRTWLQGLLYDASPQVRARAAKYIEAIQYLPYEADLKAALLRENDTKARAAMQQALDALAALRPWK